MKLPPVPFRFILPEVAAHFDSILRRFIVPLLFVFLAAFGVGAQKKGDLQLRTVRGTVLDKDENPVPSAVVYLKGMKSQAVRTYIADDAGKYRFTGAKFVWIMKYTPSTKT